MKNVLHLIILIVLSVSEVSFSYANVDLYEFSSTEHRTRYFSLTKELRCPKCQNQDIADSNSPIASDMRAEVHRLLEQGSSNTDIVNFMVDRFGEFVSYKPKVQPSTYLLWFGPWVLIAFGVIIIGLIVKRRSAPVDARDNDLLDGTHEEVEKLLANYSGDSNDNK